MLQREGKTHVPHLLAEGFYSIQHSGGKQQEWDDWHEQFEMATELAGWDEATKLKFLSLLLTENARAVYHGLSNEARQAPDGGPSGMPWNQMQVLVEPVPLFLIIRGCQLSWHKSLAWL